MPRNNSQVKMTETTETSRRVEGEGTGPRELSENDVQCEQERRMLDLRKCEYKDENWFVNI
jgi:hypothetical protein